MFEKCILPTKLLLQFLFVFFCDLVLIFDITCDLFIEIRHVDMIELRF